MKTFMLPQTKLPNGFEYPASYCKIVELGLVNIEPWFVLDTDSAADRKNGLLKRYGQELIPFAKRAGSDDIACFANSEGDKVFIIHDFATSGWEKRQIFDSFWDWFRYAVEELILDA